MTGFMLILFAYVLFHSSHLLGYFQSLLQVLSPLITGAVLAYAINIPMDFLEDRVLIFMNVKPWLQKAKRPLAFLLVLGLVVAIVAFLLTEIIPQIVQLVNLAIQRLPQLITEINEWLKSHDISMGSILMDQVMPDASNPAKMQGLLDSASKLLLGGITGGGNVLGAVFSSVLGTFFTIMFILYCVMGKVRLQEQGRKLLYASLPLEKSIRTLDVLRKANKIFRSFIAGQLLEAVILGTLLFVAMLLFSMPYALLISALTAVFAIIPIIGAWIASIAGFLLIATQNLAQAVYFLILLLVVQTIEGNVIYPRVMSTAIGLPGLWVLVAVVIGQSFFGVFGALLLIPLTSLGFQLLSEYSERKLLEKNISMDKWRI